MTASGGSKPEPGAAKHAGRILAVVAVILSAFSLRSAVASLSPVTEFIAQDFALSAAVLGLIGAAPPVCFALTGLFTTPLSGKIGLERTVIIALAAISAGLFSRGFVSDSVALMLTTMLLFAGVGMGNIVLPPLVKKYFPNHLGIMMTVYMTAMGLSTFLPPLIAVPVANASNWRVSLGLWGVFAFAAMIPWIAMVIRKTPAPTVPETGASAKSTVVEAEDDGAVSTTEAIRVSRTTDSPPRITARLWRLPLPWALMVIFMVSSVTVYSAFAWLPSMLTEIAGIDIATAGTLLSLFVLMGLPAGMIVPILVVRFQATKPIALYSGIAGVIGWLGLLIAPLPALLPLWIMGLGAVGTYFPLALVLMSIRARTPESAVALSGFVQGVGYAITAVFPVLVGLTREFTGGWQTAMIILLVMVLISFPAGWMTSKRTTIEDEWVRRHGSW